MSVALKKIAGVEDVKVSLNEGRADVKMKPGKRATLDQIRDVIRRNGFTPKAADVVARGTLALNEGRLALQVSGSDAVYMLWDAPSAAGKVGQLGTLAGSRKVAEVIVEGQVPESAARPGGGVPVLKVATYKAVEQ